RSAFFCLPSSDPERNRYACTAPPRVSTDLLHTFRRLAFATASVVALTKRTHLSCRDLFPASSCTLAPALALRWIPGTSAGMTWSQALESHCLRSRTSTVRWQIIAAILRELRPGEREMVASDSFAEFLREQLAPLGRITMRRMFGKTGVFCDGLMLGMV